MKFEHQWKNITVIPAVSQSLNHVVDVYNHLLKTDYDLICIEYPSYLQKSFIKLSRYVNELYIVNLLTFHSSFPIFIPIVPNDPFAMLSYMASKKGCPMRLIDCDMPYEYDYFYRFNQIDQRFHSPPRVSYESTLDKKRFGFMKQKLLFYHKSYKRILFLCHYNSFFSIKKTLNSSLSMSKIKPNTSKLIQVFSIHPDSYCRFIPEFPFIASIVFRYIQSESMKWVQFNEMDLIMKKIDKTLNYISKEERLLFYTYLKKNNFNLSVESTKLSTVLKTARGILDDRKFLISIKRLLTEYHFFKPYYNVKIIFFKTILENAFNFKKIHKKEEIKIEGEDFMSPFLTKENDFNIYNQDVFLLEQNLFSLMEYIKYKIYSYLQFDHYVVDLPIIIFSNDFDKYSQLNESFSNILSNLNLFFYSQKFLKEKLANKQNIIGGLSFLKNNSLNHLSFKAKKNYHYYYLYHKNSLLEYTIIPYIAKKPPSSYCLKFLKDRGNYVFYIPIDEIPFKTIMFFKNINHLGYRRLKKLKLR